MRQTRKLMAALRRDSPVALAREVAWRATRDRRTTRILALMKEPCPVTFRALGYFADLSSTDARARRAITRFADEICDGRFPFLGYGTVDLGVRPKWNRDFVDGSEWERTATSLHSCIRHDGSDVKAPLELSRLQFIPVLAKAHVLTGEERYRSAAKLLVSHWISENPLGTGINWTIAMEAALRAISLCLATDLLNPLRDDEQEWLHMVTHSLWEHWLFIDAHLEFSHLIRSNHYLSNIVGLYCLSSFLHGRATKTAECKHRAALEREIRGQIYGDGGDYEASTGYHVLVMQMFTMAYVLMRRTGNMPSAGFVQRLRSMYALVTTLADHKGRIPQLGDCDDGRVELLDEDLEQCVEVPLGARDSLTLPSLVRLGARLFGHGPAPENGAIIQGPSATVFPESGLAIAKRGALSVVFSAMPNGIGGRGSHTHNDKLAVTAQLAGEDLLSDAGTYCYTRNAELRNYYRSTRAHNTLLIDGEEQNRYSLEKGCLFATGDEARVLPIRMLESREAVILRSGHSGYRDLQHNRLLRISEAALVIEDDLVGQGQHTFEANFQLAPSWRADELKPDGAGVRCVVSSTRPVAFFFTAPVELVVEVRPSQISRTYGSRVPALKIVVTGTARLPVRLTTSLTW